MALVPKTHHRRAILAATIIVAVALCGAILMPVMSGSWPWDDDDRQIEVSGEIQCKGVDLGSEMPFYPRAKIEGFEIRGRSNVATISTNGWTGTYTTEVPPGWVIEWSVKCSNRSRWQHGSFPVTKSTFGSSYRQRHHVCVNGGLFEPCLADSFNYCIELLLTKHLTSSLPFGPAARILYNKFGEDGGTSATQCVKALRDSTPSLHQQTPPKSQPTRSPAPTPTRQPVATLPPATPTKRAPKSPASTGSPAPHTSSPTPTPTHSPVKPYDNYGAANAGHAMCRGNPSSSASMPGGTASQTFTVPAGVATLDSALVQIDPDSRVTAHLSVAVNGTTKATATAKAAGDTRFTFSPIGVTRGQTVRLSITFTSTYGKIITVYTAGRPGGTFKASNSCPDGAPNVTSTSRGLRAVVYGRS